MSLGENIDLSLNVFNLFAKNNHGYYQLYKSISFDFSTFYLPHFVTNKNNQILLFLMNSDGIFVFDLFNLSN